MLRVRVKGKLGALTRDDIREFVAWATKSLMGPQMAAQLDIDVICRRRMKDFGTCQIKKTRYFAIELNTKKSAYMQRRTLAHELVHVEQWVREKIVPLGDGEVVTWKKWREIELDDIRAPHEGEAYREEVRLYRRWRRYLKKQATLGK